MGTFPTLPVIAVLLFILVHVSVLTLTHGWRWGLFCLLVDIMAYSFGWSLGVITYKPHDK